MSLRGAIVVTGTEVVSGVIADRNGAWIADRLTERGVEVTHIIAVGDRPEDLRRALEYVDGEGAELIVTSGGLGPTADDLTAEIVAGFCGRQLEHDPAMEERIASILAGYARRMRFDPEALRIANRKQALVPAGAATVDPVGTAPGLVVPPAEGRRGPTVVVLPGPPRELRAMWDRALGTEPAQAVLAGAEPYAGRMLRLFGIPESELAQTLREIGDRAPIDSLEITTCLRRAELEVDIRARPGQEELRDQVVEGIAERHGRFLFSTDGSTIDEQVAQLLDGHRLGVAESCTGGMLAARITERPGASAYMSGAMVAYSDRAKEELLGVPPELIAAHGAVSPEVADSMAGGAIARFDADVACSITGVAGPGGGTEAKPVGYVCICVRDRHGRVLARDPVLPGNRADVRDRACVAAMHMLRVLLRGEDLPL